MKNKINKILKNLEDDNDDKVSKYLRSKKFQKDFAKTVEENTWGKDIPKIYMNDNGDIVEHWKDNTIIIKHTKEELLKK